MKKIPMRLLAWSLSIIAAYLPALAYPVMTHTYTNSSNQQNRYLKLVTTTGTETPVVFECKTVDELPFTPYTSQANVYTESGALVDKTANPIKVQSGISSFTMTLYGWDQAIGVNNCEIDWTQVAHFIDWNKNGAFNDSGEISPKGNINVPNKDIYNGFPITVSIPEGQAAGTYRMRLVFFEPQNNSENWPATLFTTLNRRIRNGVAYDMDIEILPEVPMTVGSTEVVHKSGSVAPGRKDVEIASIAVTANGSLEPLEVSAIGLRFTGDAPLSNLRWIYSSTPLAGSDVLASAPTTDQAGNMPFKRILSTGGNYFILMADVADDAQLETVIKADITSITVGGEKIALDTPESTGIKIADIIDYTEGNAFWFDTPNSSTAGAAIWTRNDFSSTSTNPDEVWERKSFPIGNGSFGGNILGSISRERVVLNEKTLWKGGPGTGVERYWNMNRTVNDATLTRIRDYLANGQNSNANSLVATNYRGNIDYSRDVFGVFTTMGEAYISTGLDENSVTDYKRIVNMDRSIVVVQFNADGSSYQRRFFASYPDSVMVWRFTSDNAAQNLTFSFNCPQIIKSVTSPAEGSLLYDGRLDNNNMQWALRVTVRTNDGGAVTVNPTARTITVKESKDVEFILAADTDYAMNFDPDFTDATAFVGVDPVANVNKIIEAATGKSYDELYANHEADYSSLFNRVSLQINPTERFANLPTPKRLSNYRNGTLDHGLEQQYFQYGRYLLISSSRAGNMPANLQGMWHNNTDGPWRVDYHNNINLQMNYWPATSTNLLECFTPFIDYVRGLVKPGERTATAYYGARGWTAEVSTNIFGFTAPLNSSDMSWNYNPTAGPWLATQIWEYYDYTRDKEWLREIGYPIIRSSADFVSDLLFKHNGTYTSAPSYSPEHGTADLGATYANAVTREVLHEAVIASEILGLPDAESAEWREKLDNMYPYQVGRYGQLQEWYRDIDQYGDQHRHTNHLFGLHPGSTINAITDTKLTEACKETLRQRGDAATGWSMGWKLNHWARLLDGDHAYILFQNLLKEGTADNGWDLHPPFQIDGNFGGTAGVTELFLQSHNGMLHLLPALPSQWTDGHITGLRTRGNFEVDITYADGKLDNAVITSNAGEPCKVYYNGHELSFDTEKGADYVVSFNTAKDELELEQSSLDSVGSDSVDRLYVNHSEDRLTATVDGPSAGRITIGIYSLSGQLLKHISIDKRNQSASASFGFTEKGVFLIRAAGHDIDLTAKLVIR